MVCLGGLPPVSSKQYYKYSSEFQFTCAFRSSAVSYGGHNSHFTDNLTENLMMQLSSETRSVLTFCLRVSIFFIIYSAAHIMSCNFEHMLDRGFYHSYLWTKFDNVLNENGVFLNFFLSSCQRTLFYGH